ncbi:hypothetical protein [Myroides odoratus]|uniref:YhhN-like protein n=1 Tax=Myroides odoratus TaxID=256 RepID=A0A378RLA8_MYROD|nr:hypothetical protein [Myroides odoratus]QQU04762.1 hypothetical protein I6I89_05590 [Myroides odoratus]STZ27792.1 Uncharacterised protein [Myroides odoratus]
MNDYYFIVADRITGIITFITFILCFINVYIFKKLNKHDKALSLYIIFCFLFDFLNYILVQFKLPNIGLLPLFNLTEVVLLLYFFIVKGMSKRMSKITVIIALSVNLFDFSGYLFIDNYILNKGRVFNSLLFITIILYVLATKINSLNDLKLFYFMLIYFTISFIQFLLLEFFIFIPDDSIFITWILYAVVGGMFYIKTTHFLWKNMRILNI